MLDEAKLVFIISQPRSGSTLAQKLLSNNSMVNTVSEPWVLLPILSIYRPDIIEAKYNYPVALQGFFDYLKKTNAEEKFRSRLKNLILNLYDPSGGDRYFVDKTPRNYEILPEIVDLFPEARFLVLKRNPFAVLYSMVNTWANGKIDFGLLKGFHRDFLIAPFKIQDFCDCYGDNRKNVLELKYEDVLQSPHSEVGKVYNWLGIPFSEEALMIGRNEKVKGIFGDDVYRKEPLQAIAKGNAHAWKANVRANKQIAAFFDGYREYLSNDFINRYGYENVDFRHSGFTWHNRFKRFIAHVGVER